jgi:hypothetical protein
MLPRPATLYHWRVPTRDLDFVRARGFRRCWVCGLPTRMIEICFEAALHRRCVKIADRAYWKTTVIGAPDLDGRFENWRLYRFLRKVGKDAPT